MNFLDNIGLEKLWYNIISKLGKKVDKEEGKGLSTNDYTTDEKNKLAGIEVGANKTVIDTKLNDTSTNPVQNKIVNAAISELKGYVGNKTVANQINEILNSQKGTASGIATLDTTGKVPSSQLPSYVDDVIEGYYYNNKFYKESGHTTEITGETAKIYVDLSTNKTYRWSGSAYIIISETLALGTTSSTAYYGDKGKVAYDHANAKGSEFASGLYKITTNAQGHVTAATAVTKSDITGLGIPAADTKVTQTVTTTNASYPLLLAPSGQTTTATTTSYFDSGVTLNPSTNTIAANISGNAASATKINTTLTNPSSNGSYAIPFHDGVSTGAKSLRTNNGLAYLTLEGTESAYGYGAIRTGNSTALGIAGNKQGRIYMYGKDAGYTLIVPGNDTSSNITLTLPSSEGVIALTKDVLPLSGGTISGKLTIGADTTTVTPLKFNRSTYNYILVDDGASLVVNCKNTTNTPTASLVISGSNVYPGATNTINLGTDSLKWKNVYASTFTGALSGNATSAGKVNSNLVIKLNGGSTEGTNLFTFNGSAAKTVNITASSIGAAALSHTHSYLPLSGGTMTGKITGVDTQTTWIGTTRNGAFRVETAASGTKAISALSMKTNSGAWSIGNLAGDDSLYFTYGTDTNYNANSNTVSNYYISTGGAWSGSAAKLTTARTLTIGKTGKKFDGSKNVSWTLAEIGAVAKAGDTMSGKLVANATSVATLGTSQIRNIWAGTADISEVENSLNEGDIYLQYEEV